MSNEYNKELFDKLNNRISEMELENAKLLDALLEKINRLKAALEMTIERAGNGLEYEGLYNLGLRAGRANVDSAECDDCIAAADKIEAVIRSALLYASGGG